MTKPVLPEDFITRAKALLGPSGFRADETTREAAETPWRGTYRGSTPLVARPDSTQMCAAFVKLCAEFGIAITPQGGNTGLVDAGTPHGEVTLSLQRMTAVRAVDPINNSLTIEAGAALVVAQETADKSNRLFPLSLGSEGTATIGGLISTNAGGVAVLRYGMMRDLLLGLEVVLPSGEIWNGLSGLRKNNTGYDLKHVFAGAEGTLGIVTAATLKLFPKVAKATAWITCETAENIVDLLALVRDHAGDTVTSFEMIPAAAIDMIRAERPEVRDPNPSNRAWRVLCEVSMAREDHARELLETALEAAFNHDLICDAIIAENLTQAQSFWTIRETIPLSKRAYGTAINHDVSVPVSQIPNFLARTEAEITSAYPGSEIIAFGHVGDGNLHYSACEASRTEPPVLANHADEITRIVHHQTMLHDGSISAEHGVGRLKRDELETIRSPAATAAMKAIKRALDPQGLMNPNRVVSSD
ncbi:MAG: FAD-binding oxidoreductase [Pseudomonadota bacterium]